MAVQGPSPRCPPTESGPVLGDDHPKLAVTLALGRWPTLSYLIAPSMATASATIWDAKLLNSTSPFLRIPALEFLPPSRGVVVPPAKGVGIDFRRHPDGRVSQALGHRRKIHAIRQEMAAMAVAQRLQAGAPG